MDEIIIVAPGLGYYFCPSRDLRSALHVSNVNGKLRIIAYGEPVRTITGDAMAKRIMDVSQGPLPAQFTCNDVSEKFFRLTVSGHEHLTHVFIDCFHGLMNIAGGADIIESIRGSGLLSKVEPVPTIQA